MDSSSPPNKANRDNEEHEQEEVITPTPDQRGKRKQTQENGATSEQPKAKKIIPPRSDVWTHFTRRENRDKCVCHHCKKDYSCPSKSGTKNMWNHLEICSSYMVITAHYIDAQWRLKKLIIGFKYVTDHKGKTIAKVLLECLTDWGIEKVFCVSVDKATANSNALSLFESSFSLLSEDSLVMKGDFLHMRCAGHIINLIVRDGFNKIDDSVTAVRNAILYFRSGGRRQEAFDLKVDSGRMTRGSLPLDVKTRWNSTYLMLLRAVKYKVAFDKMELEDKLYNDHFLEYENGAKRIGPPSMADWRAIERLNRFRIIFYDATLVVSASTTLNAHKCYGEIVNIASELQLLCTNYDSEKPEKPDPNPN
ncbi:hypothetical protein CARUB_v10006642mg, partial [Capsella rubella]